MLLGSCNGWLRGRLKSSAAEVVVVVVVVVVEVVVDVVVVVRRVPASGGRDFVQVIGKGHLPG